ncbi:DUF2238 domain-containing protein [Acinetobacter indicus]|uniref:DUF2238 domain-containing protein n=1 Tax=Acinetobacter indicus TaxID=756892 RepID=UPI0014447EC5|nr:DUF2238 domain-containing protein [Acinetobacter indicus]
MIDYQLQAKHWLMLVLLGLAMLLASINPMEFSAYVLHQVGTILMLIVLLLLFKKVGLNFSSFVFYLIFLLIHILGAHYLYSYVPYNEWLEWLLAVTLSPEAAENYNGQQGDVWDAHKDMLLATLGAILAGSWNLYKDRKKALD